MRSKLIQLRDLTADFGNIVACLPIHPGTEDQRTKVAGLDEQAIIYFKAIWPVIGEWRKAWKTSKVGQSHQTSMQNDTSNSKQRRVKKILRVVESQTPMNGTKQATFCQNKHKNDDRGEVTAGNGVRYRKKIRRPIVYCKCQTHVCDGRWENNAGTQCAYCEHDQTIL